MPIKLPIRTISPPVLSPDTRRPPEEVLEELKPSVEQGKPIELLEAIAHCADNCLQHPKWLTEQLITTAVRYHSRQKSEWRGKPPKSVIKKRLIIETRVRAVNAIKAWVDDKNEYKDMPTKCIELWEKQLWKHSGIKTQEQIERFAAEGLKGLTVDVEGTIALGCTDRTIRRSLKAKEAKTDTPITGAIAEAFGFKNPDIFFGIEGRIIMPED